MGSCYSGRKEPQKLAFGITEMNSLENKFAEYCDLSSESRERQCLNQKIFEEIFKENVSYGIRLYDFMEAFCQDQWITKEKLFEFLEVMIKDSQATSIPQFKNFRRFELFSLISIQDHRILNSKEELRDMQLTYLQATQICKDIIKTYQTGLKEVQYSNEKYLRAFVDQLFKNEQGSQSWSTFIDQVFKQWLGIDRQILWGFIQGFKFILIIFFCQNPIPIMSHPSQILTDELYFQLLISTDSILKNCYKLQLLYSTELHFDGLKQMMKLTVASKLPTLILIQHEEKYEQITRQQQFAILSNLHWLNASQFFGTKDDCLISLFPHFKVFRTKKQEKNYCYMDGNKGIGFGKDGKNYRVWIDSDLKKSYIGFQDDTFESGHIVHPHIKELKINLIEVWGILHPSDEFDPDEVKQDIKDPILDIKAEELKYDDSNANYYWLMQQKKEVQNSGYYWESDNKVILEADEE